MKRKLKLFIVTILGIGFYSCSNSQVQNSTTELDPKAFLEKLKGTSQAILLDVRTPGEFGNGHLERAQNMDWNGGAFSEEVSRLEKDKPVFVYCLSGGRSSNAANEMRKIGFKEVYELKGGILKWRAEGLPETLANAVWKGMTKSQFEKLTETDKLVLIDFYADWCEPCKKMKPYLDEISKDQVDKVVVVRLNADENQDLCKELKVDGLPVLMLYKNKALIWENKGFVTKEELLRHLQ